MAIENRSARRKRVNATSQPLGFGFILTERRALAVAVIALALALASTALGAPTTIPLTSIGIKVVAAPGTQNHVSIRYGVFEQGNDGFHIDAQYITDTAGLIVVPGEDQICTQPAGNTSACVDTGTTAGIPDGSTGTGEYPTISLGDRADTLISDNVGDLEVFGGPGNDVMAGSSRPIIVGAFEGEPGYVIRSEESFFGEGGDDVLKGNGEPDVLDGGPGRDTLLGGKGPDFLNARDGRKDAKIDCGPGNDKAKVDKVDPKPISC